MTEDTITRDTRAARERLAMALADARELVEVRTKDIRRCIERGLAWSHPSVRTNRARLAAAIADLTVLELLLARLAPPPRLDTAIPPLAVRGRDR